MNPTAMHVQCRREPTPQIAVGSQQPGLLTYTLDPEHFSQIAVDGISAALDTMATNGSWHYHGQNRLFATQYEVRRNPERRWGAPVIFCDVPGWTAISVDAQEMTESGRLALEGAIWTQMSGWEQTTTDA
jgi:hypothetical protein